MKQVPSKIEQHEYSRGFVWFVAMTLCLGFWLTIALLSA
jgi:hypothetical protein